VIRVLLVGDLVAGTGRRLLVAHLESLIDSEGIDFVIANVENAAGGRGLTVSIMAELDELPVDVWTSGNHIWDKKEGVGLLEGHPALLRPANYPAGVPGRGWCVETTPAGVDVAVVNLQGRVFMEAIDCPFQVADRVVAEIAEQHPEARVVIVDMHAEATSEKQALAVYLDGRVTAVLGTHTHVPTADERVLEHGTAFQTDVGMTGAWQSVIGMRADEVLHRFLYHTPKHLQPARRGGVLCGAVVEADETDGRARSIRRVQIVGRS
jgi:hypothetical protein